MSPSLETLPLRTVPKTVEAACYNRVRLALLRLENPLRLSMAQHRGLDIILHDDHWICVDSCADDLLILAWREFQTHGRDDLCAPITCELSLYHHCAGLIMGSVLDDLQQVIEQCLHQGE